MNWKAYLPLAVAVVLGLLAARVAMNLVSTGPKVMVGPMLVPMAVTGRDIEPGTTLTDADLTIARVAGETLPMGAFTSVGQGVGRVTKIALVRGQAITPNLLADEGAGYGVSATLPPGMRAVTIDISDTTGVAGFILPKCRVDVIATLQTDGKSIAKTVLEGVTVLAVGSRTNPTAPVDPQQPSSRTITLLVKPKDVEKVELAATMSRIRLVLRNGRDESLAQSNGITMTDLKGGRENDPFANDVQQASATTQPVGILPIADHQPTTRPASLTWTVQVIKAGVISAQTFDAATNAPKSADPFENETDTDADRDMNKTVDVTHEAAN